MYSEMHPERQMVAKQGRTEHYVISHISRKVKGKLSVTGTFVYLFNFTSGFFFLAVLGFELSASRLFTAGLRYRN
jgi:hypothetical protein